MTSYQVGDRLTTGSRQPSLYRDVRFLACRQLDSSALRLRILSSKISNRRTTESRNNFRKGTFLLIATCEQTGMMNVN